MLEILVRDLMRTAAPPPSGSGIEERRRALVAFLIWEIAREWNRTLQIDGPVATEKASGDRRHRRLRAYGAPTQHEGRADDPRQLR